MLNVCIEKTCWTVIPDQRKDTSFVVTRRKDENMSKPGVGSRHHTSLLVQSLT